MPTGLSVWLMSCCGRRMFRRILSAGLLVWGLAVPPVSAASSPWKENKSDHFIVACQHVPPDFVREVIRTAEANYIETMTTLGFTRYKGWAWGSRVRITIYDSREAYVDSSHYGWSAGEVNPASREIVTFPSESGFFDAILPHELGHIIFHEAVGFRDIVPLWLDEGVAMYQEKARRLGADAAVRELIHTGRYMPLDVLSRMDLGAGTDRDTVDGFYNEAASLVGFLINKGEVYRFARLCDELRGGRRFAWALRKAYMQYTDPAELEKAWRRYLNEAAD